MDDVIHPMPPVLLDSNDSSESDWNNISDFEINSCDEEITTSTAEVLKTRDPQIRSNEPELLKQLNFVQIYYTKLAHENFFQLTKYVFQNSDLNSIILSAYIMPLETDKIYIETSDISHVKMIFPDSIFFPVKPYQIATSFCSYTQFHPQVINKKKFGRFFKFPYNNVICEILDVNFRTNQCILQCVTRFQPSDPFAYQQIIENSKSEKIPISFDKTKCVLGCTFRGQKLSGSMTIIQTNMKYVKTWSASINENETKPFEYASHVLNKEDEDTTNFDEEFKLPPQTAPTTKLKYGKLENKLKKENDDKRKLVQPTEEKGEFLETDRPRRKSKWDSQFEFYNGSSDDYDEIDSDSDFMYKGDLDDKTLRSCKKKCVPFEQTLLGFKIDDSQTDGENLERFLQCSKNSRKISPSVTTMRFPPNTYVSRNELSHQIQIINHKYEVTFKQEEEIHKTIDHLNHVLSNCDYYNVGVAIHKTISTKIKLIEHILNHREEIKNLLEEYKELLDKCTDKILIPAQETDIRKEENDVVQDLWTEWRLITKSHQKPNYKACTELPVNFHNIEKAESAHSYIKSQIQLIIDLFDKYMQIIEKIEHVLDQLYDPKLKGLAMELRSRIKFSIYQKSKKLRVMNEIAWKIQNCVNRLKGIPEDAKLEDITLKYNRKSDTVHRIQVKPQRCNSKHSDDEADYRPNFYVPTTPSVVKEMNDKFTEMKGTPFEVPLSRFRRGIAGMIKMPTEELMQALQELDMSKRELLEQNATMEKVEPIMTELMIPYHTNIVAIRAFESILRKASDVVSKNKTIITDYERIKNEILDVLQTRDDLSEEIPEVESGDRKELIVQPEPDPELEQAHDQELIQNPYSKSPDDQNFEKSVTNENQSEEDKQIKSDGILDLTSSEATATSTEPPSEQGDTYSLPPSVEARLQTLESCIGQLQTTAAMLTDAVKSQNERCDALQARVDQLTDFSLRVDVLLNHIKMSNADLALPPCNQNSSFSSEKDNTESLSIEVDHDQPNSEITKEETDNRLIIKGEQRNVELPPDLDEEEYEDEIFEVQEPTPANKSVSSPISAEISSHHQRQIEGKQNRIPIGSLVSWGKIPAVITKYHVKSERCFILTYNGSLLLVTEQSLQKITGETSAMDSYGHSFKAGDTVKFKGVITPVEVIQISKGYAFGKMKNGNDVNWSVRQTKDVFIL